MWLEARDDKNDLIAKLEKKIHLFHDKNAAAMPADVRLELTNLNSVNELMRVSLKSQKWLHDNLNQMDDLEAAKDLASFKELHTGDDLYKLLSETFWCRLKGRPIELENKIRLIGLYWKENAKPVAPLAPEGKGVVDWIWKLNIKTRPDGILHVGIDTKSRRFLCYEHTIGLYYPEGAVLERIRAEIVQEPKMAGKFLGKGRIQHVKD